MERILRQNHPKGDHQHCANDGGAGTVNLHAWKFADGKDQITAQKDRVGRKNADSRENDK